MYTRHWNGPDPVRPNTAARCVELYVGALRGTLGSVRGCVTMLRGGEQEGDGVSLRTRRSKAGGKSSLVPLANELVPLHTRLQTVMCSDGSDG